MVLSIQDKLVEKIQKKFLDAEIKKVNRDNFLDIHIPSIYPKRGAHLFFNTAKEEIKIGFFCRDEEFVQLVLARESSIESYSQGLRPLGNKSFSNVEDAITVALDFLEKISINSKKMAIDRIDDAANYVVNETEKEKVEKLEMNSNRERTVPITEVLGTLPNSKGDFSSESTKAAVIKKETTSNSIEINKPVFGNLGLQKEAPLTYSFDEKRVNKVKKLNSSESLQFLASIKENLFTVPVPELVVQLIYCHLF